MDTDTIEFISLGGWCGTKIALHKNNYLCASYPFDYVRSSILGVIDCFENDFTNYFPEYGSYIQDNGLYLSKCCEFHHEDITNISTIQSFHRKIKRFKEQLNKKNVNICFLRTICLNDYDNELKYYTQLRSAIEKNYPNLSFIICFIITKQFYTTYYKNLDDKTFIFVIKNDNVHGDHKYLKEQYSYIFNFIINNNLFMHIPPSKELHMIKRNNYLETFGLLHT